MGLCVDSMRLNNTTILGKVNRLCEMIDGVRCEFRRISSCIFLWITALLMEIINFIFVSIKFSYKILYFAIL